MKNFTFSSTLVYRLPNGIGINFWKLCRLHEILTLKFTIYFQLFFKLVMFNGFFSYFEFFFSILDFKFGFLSIHIGNIEKFAVI